MQALQFNRILATALLTFAAALGCAHGQRSDQLINVNRDVGFDQKLDNQVPGNLPFKDENGRDVTIGSYFGRKPIILSLVYYGCPLLCTQSLNGMVGTLKVIRFNPSKDFTLLTVSIDPHETPALAAAKKLNYVRQLNRPGSDDGWHFLTGSQESIVRLTDAVGFRFRFDPTTKLYAHTVGLVLLTPDGKTSRYFYPASDSFEYSPKELQFGLIEASNGKIGSPAQKALLYFCYQYNAGTGRYGIYVIGLLRLTGVLTALILGSYIFINIRRERSRAHASPDEESVTP